MNPFHDEIKAMVSRAGLPLPIDKEITALLCDSETGVAPYRSIRLLKLLSNIKSGLFCELPAPKKKSYLETFVELLNHKKGYISKACALFFGQTSGNEQPKQQLPEDMITCFVKAVRTERVEKVRALIWDVLWREGAHLAKFIKLDDLARCLWVDDPLTRNNLIMFMFRNFSGDKVVESIFKQRTLKNGKKIPKGAYRQLIAVARAETTLNHRNRTLSRLMDTSRLSEDKADRIWSDYLKGLSRFELIRIFSMNRYESPWIDDLEQQQAQLSFDFRPVHSLPSHASTFSYRIQAIRGR